MARARYSKDEKQQIRVKFIEAAINILKNEGIDRITIRRVGELAGYNSATLYLYFQDVDELKTYASMKIFEEYCESIAIGVEQKKFKDEYQTYMYSWVLFCNTAFKYPQVFYHLFFVPHTVALESVICHYYELFPNHLTNITGTLNDMIHKSSLEMRNYQVLYPLVQAGIIEKKNVSIINRLSVCFFKRLLEEKMELGDAISDTRQTRKMLDASRYLIKR